MKNKTAQTIVSPTVEYLTNILAQMTADTLVIPKFHRPYIDDATQIFFRLNARGVALSKNEFKTIHKI